jgi:hypothetical protein
MTRDDIIRMAREAGLHVTNSNSCGISLVARKTDSGALVHLTVDELMPFVSLVTAAEREECAKACNERSSFVLGLQNGPDDLLQNTFLRHRATEGKVCAEAIRARSNKG